MEAVNLNFGDLRNYLPTHLLKLQYIADIDPHLTEADLKHSDAKRLTADEVLNSYQFKMMEAKTKLKGIKVLL